MRANSKVSLIFGLCLIVAYPANAGLALELLQQAASVVRKTVSHADDVLYVGNSVKAVNNLLNNCIEKKVRQHGASRDIAKAECKAEQESNCINHKIKLGVDHESAAKQCHLEIEGGNK